MASNAGERNSDAIGRFEEILLTAVVSLGGETYGVPIYEKACAIAERRINLGAFYTTMDRLEEKGLLSSWESDPAKEPRGRPKRYYRIQPAGLRALEQVLKNAQRLKEILDDNSGR